LNIKGDNMYGTCENCGNKENLDCCYSQDTGQEIYICEECDTNMSQEDKKDLANYG